MARGRDRRVALVTGANRGIGFETCRQLGLAGLRVIVTARDGDKARAAAARLVAEGLDAVAQALDVSDAASVTRAHHELAARHGPIEVLVNNAAVLEAEGSQVLDIDLDLFRSTLETNLLGAIAVCRAFVPGMVAGRYGRVVNVSSTAGQLASMSGYAPAYAISKAALNAFTRLLAAATHASNVLVNSVDPGWVRTDMGGPHAPRSVEQGADGVVWLATLPDDGPTGGFFRDRHPIEW